MVDHDDDCVCTECNPCACGSDVCKGEEPICPSCHVAHVFRPSERCSACVREARNAASELAWSGSRGEVWT